jgi:hypothetical protein
MSQLVVALQASQPQCKPVPNPALSVRDVYALVLVPYTLGQV